MMLFCMTAVFMLAGCETESKTLEDYLADSPSAQQEIEESLSGLSNSDMDVAVTYEQNRIIITCNMKTTYKKRVLKAMKRSYRKYLEEHMEKPMASAIASIEQDTGISGVTIKVTINNGNGKEMWSELYPLETDDGEKTTEETTAEEAESESSSGE